MRQVRMLQPGGSRGYTLVELMVVISMIGLISAIAYPRVTDTLRKMRARDGAKAVINAVLIAKSEAMIRNLAHQLTFTTSASVGSLSVTGGGSILTQRATGSACVGALTQVDRYSYAQLRDVNLCNVKTTAVGTVEVGSDCPALTVNLCVTPDGTITNLGTPAAAYTLVYVRENEVSGGSVSGTGVVRQIVIPRRKSVKVNPIQVTDDVCL